MRKRISTAIFALVLLGGCGENTNPAGPLPSGPSFDGGWTIGSGGRSDTTTTNPPSSQSTASGTPCVASEDGGGWTIGSGGAAAGAPDAGQCEVQ